MRASIIFGSLLATVALSKPIQRRETVTDNVWVTVYTTETVDGVSTVDPWGGRHHWTVDSSVTTSSATSVAPVSTPTTTTTQAAATTTSSSTPVITPSADVTSSTFATYASYASTMTSGSAAYEQMILDQHNNHRANHSSPFLVWNDTLADIAESIGETCYYAHNTTAGGGGYGQNIGAGAPPNDVGAMLTNEMYGGEINLYPLPWGVASPDMTNFENWGHFSQIVWNNTVSVGCATVTCSTLGNTEPDVAPYFTVCNYYPAGNFAGEYYNVQAPLGEPSVVVAN